MKNKFLVESGSEDIYWGDLTESELRKLRKAGYLADKIPYDGPTKRIIDILDRHTIPSEIVRSLFHLPHYLYLNYDLILPGTLRDETAVALPICASMASIALALKFGKSDLFGKGAYRFLGRNIMRTPAAIRLHTLATSSFSHTRLIDVIQYSSVILFFGSSYLELPKRTKDGNRLHTDEATTFYHLLAFCITAGTLTSFSSQLRVRILFNRIKHFYGKQVATKIIGRRAEFGAGGLTSSILGAFYLLCFLQSKKTTYFLQPNPKEAKAAIDIVLFLPLMFFGMDVVMPATRIYYRSLVIRSNVVARAVGFYFGLNYMLFGLDYWEHLKEFFSKRDQRLQAAIGKSIKLVEKKGEEGAEKIINEAKRKTLSHYPVTAPQASKRLI